MTSNLDRRLAALEKAKAFVEPTWPRWVFFTCHDDDDDGRFMALRMPSRNGEPGRTVSGIKQPGKTLEEQAEELLNEQS